MVNSVVVFYYLLIVLRRCFWCSSFFLWPCGYSLRFFYYYYFLFIYLFIYFFVFCSLSYWCVKWTLSSIVITLLGRGSLLLCCPFSGAYVVVCIVLFLLSLDVITKTCLYNFDPLKPHFHTVKLGVIEVCIIFPFCSKHCGYSQCLWVTTMFWATSNRNLCFEQKYEKYQFFLSENFQFLVVKLSKHLNRRVFVMIGRLYTVIVAIPGQLQYCFALLNKLICHAHF